MSGTGAAGLTLGGGFGRLARRFGLACDNLIGADVLTANGSLLVASERENADLLWGLRGGGNLGIATSLEYRLHEVTPMMMGGTLVFPFTQPRTLLRAFADFIAGASDELFVMKDYPAGRGYYLKSGFIQRISPRLIDALVDYLEAASSPAGIASIIQPS